MKIIHKMMIGFLSVVSLIWVVGYFAVHSSQKALQGSIAKGSILLATQILDGIDRDIYEKMQIFEEYSKDLILQEAISRSNREFASLPDIGAYVNEMDRQWASEPDGEARPFMRKVFDNRLSEELREKTEFYEERYGFNIFPSVTVTNRYGVVVAMTERAGRYGYGGERWWLEAKKNGSYFGDVRHDEDTGANVMDIGIRVDGANGDFIGVIRAALNIETMNRALKWLKEDTAGVLPRSMHLKLATRDGRLIYSTERFKFLEDASALLKEFMPPGKGHNLYFIRGGYEPGEGEELSVHVHSKGHRDYKGLGWVMMVDYETDDIFSPVAELRYRILAFSLIAAAAAVLIASVISRSLSRPIERLRDAAVEFGRGGANVRFEAGSRDEIGVLADAFSRMAEERRGIEKELESSRQLLIKESDALKESESGLRNIFESVQTGIVLIDPETDRIIDANPIAVKSIGASKEEIISSPASRYISPVGNGRSTPVDSRQNDDNTEGVLVTAEGERRSIVKTAAPVIMGGRGLLLESFIDVTEHRRMEEELRAAQEERKERLAVLGSLAGGVGHELRNPLGVISNAVYYLKTVLTGADENVMEYLDMIKDEVNNSQRIISDLLDFSRTKTPQTQLVSAGEVIRQSLEKCSIPRSVSITIDIPETLPMIRVDPFQISQVFQNLATNAVQAMAGGGGLEISARESGESGALKFAVRDTGEGISPEDMKKLFRPLFTTKARGIGLGLVVSKKLVEANGGRIEAESQPGKGTVFTVTLPAAEG